MDFTERILIVDDQVGALGWLEDFLEWRGYKVEIVTNEKDARAKLGAVQRGEVAYAMAILDVMLPSQPIEEIGIYDAEFFESSINTGVRLCEYARRELGLTASQLPLVCLSARQDDELELALKTLDVPLFDRSGEGIREYLIVHLASFRSPRNGPAPDEVS